MSDELQDPNSIDAGNLVNTTTGGNLAYSSAVGLVSGASAQGAQVLLSGHGQIQFASIAANSFGQALGSSLAGQLQSTPGETQAAAVATTAIAPLGGNVGQPFTPLPQIPSYADEGVPTEQGGNSLSDVAGTPVGPDSGITTYAIGDPNAPVVPTLEVTTTADYNGPVAEAVQGPPEQAAAIRDLLNSQQPALRYVDGSPIIDPNTQLPYPLPPTLNIKNNIAYGQVLSTEPFPDNYLDLYQ